MLKTSFFSKTVLRFFGLVFFASTCSLVFSRDALDTRRTSAGAEPASVFSEFPITVECRVKLEKTDGYSVIVANETKASSTHWEIFTTPKNGEVSFYAPGFSPNHLRSHVDICDNRWRHIAAVIEKEAVSLYIDGDRRGNVSISRSSGKRIPGALMIGSLAEGGNFCQGEISEVRISRGVREIDPDVPMKAEESTLAFWQFKNAVDGVYRDLSGNDRHAVVKQPRKITKAHAAAKKGTAFLCSTHRQEKLIIVDDRGEIRWEYPCNHPQDVWMLENGHVLVAWYHAVQEIRPDYASGKGGEIVWEYKTGPPNEIPNCQPLPDGNVLIGIGGECRLIEVDRQGAIVREVTLSTPVKSAHSQIRFARKTPQGTYLVPFQGEGAVRELDADGKVLREFPKRSGPVGALRLPNGNTLLTGGGKVVEYDMDDKVVWELAPVDIPDISIGVFAGIQRLSNGNTIVSNWGARNEGGKIGAHIFEVTPDKKVVWTVESTEFGKVASCRILTPDFKPIPNENCR